MDASHRFGHASLYSHHRNVPFTTRYWAPRCLELVAILPVPLGGLWSKTPRRPRVAPPRLPSGRDLPNLGDAGHGWGRAGAQGAKETARGRVPVDTGTASAPGFGQFAVTSIILGFAARGAGTLTSSMPFACVAFTSAASTPSGSWKLRWNAPYATSRTK